MYLQVTYKPSQVGLHDLGVWAQERCLVLSCIYGAKDVVVCWLGDLCQSFPFCSVSSFTLAANPGAPEGFPIVCVLSAEVSGTFAGSST